MIAGCLSRGTMDDMIVIDPFIRPDEPMPAIALPTMNMGDDWAAPHSADPTSKMAK